MVKRVEKFPAHEVEYLLAVVKGLDIEFPDDCKWISKLTSIEARDILLYRFYSIISTLIEVCLKGKYWTSYSKTFLRMFARKGVPLQNIATVLKKELSCYDKKEIWHAGQIAILMAIEKTEKNLASTIVFQFKEEIARLINKEAKSYLIIEIDESYMAADNSEGDLAWDLFLEGLTESEWIIANKLIEGEKLNKGEKIPKSLEIKLKEYMNS